MDNYGSVIQFENFAATIQNLNLLDLIHIQLEPMCPCTAPERDNGQTILPQALKFEALECGSFKTRDKPEMSQN